MNEFERFVAQFTHEIIPVIKVGRNCYLVNDAVAQFKDKIHRDVFALGVFLGEEKNYFIPSPALIDIIAKKTDSEQHKLFINKKAEWLFLCGKNIFDESVLRPQMPQEGSLVLVQNELDENLGYGLIKKEDRWIIKNLLDKGYYLRVDDKKGHKKR